MDRAVAQPEDPLSVAAKAGRQGPQAVDFTDYFCDAAKCYTVVDGVNVSYDANHFNRVCGELLAPMLLDRLPK
ncbi:SGNH hydrolase domain-containing protein [uncultured Arthrobacter sp.]|uniref:SGNH hydrolase domain-containing protein n=1 Tax=uncultured Arthrobacter sp. TaxID=114050 RepID=UPI0028D4B612|nr:SGNH hydrolase domain-containing protein [uncultured Arthrobacter sp.]